MGLVEMLTLGSWPAAFAVVGASWAVAWAAVMIVRETRRSS